MPLPPATVPPFRLSPPPLGAGLVPSGKGFLLNPLSWQIVSKAIFRPGSQSICCYAYCIALSKSRLVLVRRGLINSITFFRREGQPLIAQVDLGFSEIYPFISPPYLPTVHWVIDTKETGLSQALALIVIT